MISIAMMLAAATPSAEVNPLANTARRADPICAAVVRASDRGVPAAELARLLGGVRGFGSDSIVVYCAGYLAGTIAEREGAQ